MKQKFILIALLTISIYGNAKLLRATSNNADTVIPKEIDGIQILNLTKENLSKNISNIASRLQSDILYIGIDNQLKVTSTEPLKDIGASVENESLLKVSDDSFIVRVTGLTEEFKVTFYIVSKKEKLVIREIKYRVRTIPIIQ
jgi:hypothetical protein